MKTTLFFLAFLLSFDTTIGQDLKQLINADYNNKPLKQILFDLNGSYGIKFTYANHNIPLDKKITINSNDQPLEEFLNELFQLADLEYRVFHDYVALNRASIEVKEQKSIPENEINMDPDLYVSSSPDQSRTTKTEIQTEYSELILHIESRGLTEDNYFHFHEIMMPDKQEIFKNKIPENKIIEKNSLFDVSILYSLDYLHLQGRSIENENFKYQSKLNYSMGVSGRLKLSGNLYLNLQALYSSKDFDLFYNFQTNQKDDPFLPVRTNYDLTYIDLPIFINYNFAEKNKWEFIAEMGMIYSFLTEKESQTYIYDNSSIETPLFLTGNIRDKVLSLQSGIKIRYHLKNDFSLNLSPGYRYYLKSINYDGPPVRADMIQCSFGLMYSF